MRNMGHRRVQKALCLFVILWRSALFVPHSTAQQAVHPCWQGMIFADSLKADLAALTAPPMEGRGTGQPGFQKAAEFVASRLKAWDLTPLNRENGDRQEFFHPVPYLRVATSGGTFTLGDQKWKMGRDFVPTSRRRLDNMTLAPIHRIQCAFQSRADKDPLEGLIPGTNGFSLLMEGRYSPNSLTQQIECFQDLRKRASAMGCSQIFYRPKGFTAFQKQWAEEESHRPRIRLREMPGATNPNSKKSGGVPAAPMQEFAVSGALYRSLLRQATKTGAAKPSDVGSVVIHNQIDSFSAPNVVGMIRGKSRPNEYILLSAHLDHLGLVDGQVYQGADDNGSGSAVLLSVARALAQLARQNIHPDRSIVIVWFSGEENGLLGSRWMASTLADSLGIKSGQVFANLNMDMLGRHDEEHESEEPYLYVVHHHENTSIGPFAEQVNKLCGQLKLDFRYSRADDPERLFMRSDHYAFHQLGIPAFFLFSGLHEDYHKPTDTAEKISLSRLTRNAGYVLNLAWQMAQRPGRLDLVEPRP